MCFSQCCKFCVICLTTCLPVLGLKGNDLSTSTTTSSTTVSSRFYDQLKPMAAPLEGGVGNDPDHHDGNRTNLKETHRHPTDEELIQWRNYYIQNLFNRYSSDTVLKFDGLIHMLENLGIDQLVFQGHSHVGHSHVTNDEHSSHSHDSDHDKHIHDSEHDKHKPETDHQDNRHGGLDHQHDNTETDHDHHDHDEPHPHVHNNGSDHSHHHSSSNSNVETNKHMHDHDHSHDHNGDHHENQIVNDEHSSHSHDSDQDKHIHDSDHDKHKLETDHQDNHHRGLDHQHDNTETDHDHHNHDHDEAYHHVHNSGSDHLQHRNSSKSNVETDKHLHDHDQKGDHHDKHNEHTHAGNHIDILQRDEGIASTLSRQDSDHFEKIEPEEGQCDNQNLLDRFNINEDNIVSEERFLQLCPAILSTLVTPKCLEAHNHDNQDDQDILPEKQSVYTSLQETPAEVWGYSTVSIFIISLVGLLGIIIVPLMQKVFYNHLLQFLVALAVGALSGDAMLHLLPHALIGHDHSNDDNSGNGNHDDSGHNAAVLKGLCGLAGIFLFFTMERVLSIVTDLKRKRKKNGAVFVKDTGEVVEDDTNIPLTECGATRVTDTDCKEQVMGIHPGQKALANFAESSHKKCSRNSDSIKDDRSEMIDEEDPSSVWNHSHKHHGHSHILPNSVASIAWMMILGDGIHKFSDGLAIGAAFSNSITGGFSTSIAIFCHEFPHEIGDFAVLLRAGMTVKQAVMYNCVSSFLAFIGVMIGVAIGNIGQANAWVFIFVAGMFLYIALVDMLPELTSVNTRQGEHPFSHFFLQVIGMLLGAIIMLLIALYEDRLLAVLEPV